MTSVCTAGGCELHLSPGCLREPRLLSLGDALFLYVSKLGDDRYDFEPQGVWLAAPGG